MRAVDVSIVFLTSLLAVGFAAYLPPPIRVPVETKYITTEVQTAHQDETMVLIGLLCKQSQNMAVNVSVLLNNNVDWDPAFGVFRYYIVDAAGKTESSALCSNTNAAGEAGPNCLIKSWPSSNDIYIKGTAGGVEAISFTLDAEFFTKTSDEAAYIRAHAPALRQSNLKHFDSPKVRDAPNRDPVYLTEIISISTIQALDYHRSALLNFTFCPTPKTGSRYEVRATVTGTDGRSSYTQYLCNKFPCVVDGHNVIAHNGRQLPSNTVTTSSGQWSNLYALIVGWGGVFDPTKGQYIGHFVFNAVQIVTV